MHITSSSSKSRLLGFSLLLVTGWGHAAGWSPLGGAAPSAARLGSAYAGTAAIAEDASTVSANPAGMMNLSGAQVLLGGQWQMTSMTPQFAGVEHQDVAEDRGDVYAYWSHPISARWTAGLAVTSPYGFATRYPDGWSGQAIATQTRVSSQNINPALAYRADEQWTYGFGLNYETLKLDWQRAGQIYQASGSGLGWNAGAQVQVSPAMRLGFAYRSPIRHSLKGELNGVAGQDAVVETPDSLTFSVWQQYSDQWEAMGEMAYVRWSRLDRLSPTQDPAFSYRDSWRFAWGAAYRHDDKLKSRFGFSIEKSPVTDDNRTARWPDDSAIWLSLGLQYRWYRSGWVDLGWAYRLPSKVGVTQGVSGEYAVDGQVLGVQFGHVY